MFRAGFRVFTLCDGDLCDIGGRDQLLYPVQVFQQLKGQKSKPTSKTHSLTRVGGSLTQLSFLLYGRGLGFKGQPLSLTLSFG
jgi:hypothetical protein